jgi:hypothetical protein
VLFSFAHALDVYLFCLSELTTVLALGDRAALFLYLEKRAVCVFAGRGAVAFDTCFTSVFFIADENLDEGKVGVSGKERGGGTGEGVTRAHHCGKNWRGQKEIECLGQMTKMSGRLVH